VRLKVFPNEWHTGHTCERRASKAVLPTEATSPDGGSAAPILRDTAFLHAHGAFDHFEVFSRSDVVALVGDHVDKSAASALVGPMHQLCQLLLAGFRSLSQLGKVLAVLELISARIGEQRHWVFHR